MYFGMHDEHQVLQTTSLMGSKGQSENILHVINLLPIYYSSLEMNNGRKVDFTEQEYSIYEGQLEVNPKLPFFI